MCWRSNKGIGQIRRSALYSYVVSKPMAFTLGYKQNDISAFEVLTPHSFLSKTLGTSIPLYEFVFLSKYVNICWISNKAIGRIRRSALCSYIVSKPIAFTLGYKKIDVAAFEALTP